MTPRALLLAPPRGLGGGIERYAETLESAFAAQAIDCARLDLDRPGMAAHARMLAQARGVLRAGAAPSRLVLTHRALLPVASLLARSNSVRGISVVCHGADAWGERFRPRRLTESRLMRQSAVRAVAVSSYTAGALSRNCPASVLPPGLSRNWFQALAGASEVARAPGRDVHVLTTFRLSDWRDKGLPQVLAAIAALGRADVRLTVCGNGEPPPGLMRAVREHPFCALRPGLSDAELARQFAAADLFVLATRTRPGRGPCGEGFGLVLLEAQIAGTPVIAPAYGGSHEAFIDGVTGVAPVDETAGELARVLADLLQDPERLVRMGKNAAAWAQEIFAPERYARLAVARLL